MTAALDAARHALTGTPAWVVGGAVRDRLLGRHTTDIDIVVDGSPRTVARQLAAAANGAPFELSERFGAWRVVARDHRWQVDVMSLQGASLTEDLARRDFTINAIAEPLEGGAPIDPHGGQRDLRAGVLRAVSETTFDDDPLRVLRLARFACELGLRPDEATLAQARSRAPRTREVAPERCFFELKRVLASDAVVEGLRLLDRLGVVEQLLPELAALHGVQQNRFHHLDVHGHTLEALEHAVALQVDPLPSVGAELADDVAAWLREPFADDLTRGSALRLGTLLHDIAKPVTQARDEHGTVLGFPGHADAGAETARAMLARLRASERLRAHVEALARHHLRAGYLVKHAPLSRRLIHRYLRATGSVAVDVTLLSIADRLATRGRNAQQATERHLAVARVLLGAALERERDGEPPPLIRGDALAAELGIEPGARLGELLEELAEARYAGEVGTVAEAVAYARALAS